MTCPRCGAAVETVRGETEVPYFPGGYLVRHTEPPTKRVPCTFLACTGCEYCEEQHQPVNVNWRMTVKKMKTTPKQTTAAKPAAPKMTAAQRSSATTARKRAEAAAKGAAAPAAKPADVAAIVAKNNARVEAAMKAEGVKVSDSLTPAQLDRVVKQTRTIVDGVKGGEASIDEFVAAATGVPAAKQTKPYRARRTIGTGATVQQAAAAKAAAPGALKLATAPGQKTAAVKAARGRAAKPAAGAATGTVACSKCGRINRNPANHPDCFSPKACAARAAAAAGAQA